VAGALSETTIEGGELTLSNADELAPANPTVIAGLGSLSVIVYVWVIVDPKIAPFGLESVTAMVSLASGTMSSMTVIGIVCEVTPGSNCSTPAGSR
jgi:hypothetical protein